MRIDKIRLYKYKIEMNPELKLKNDFILKVREGFIIRLIADNMAEGLGEISPLSGFSLETMDDVFAQITISTSHMVGMELPNGILRLDGQLQKMLAKFALYPSVQFGIEMAIFNLFANHKNVALQNLVNHNPRDKVSITGLLMGERGEIINQTEELINNGYRDIKLKVGGNIAEDVKTVRLVNSIIDGKALLHLDANQKWDFSQAVEFGREIGCAAATYIEEPFYGDLKQVTSFFSETLIPVAVDESFISNKTQDIKSIEGIELVVLKPTLIGGIEKTAQMITELMHYGLKCVISSLFESPLGIFALANMATIPNGVNYAGVGTIKWFKDDLLNNDFMDLPKIGLMRTPVSINDLNPLLIEEIILNEQ